MAVPRSEDWKIGAREMVWRSPELRVEMMKDIQELLATGDDEDRQAARRLAKDILELEFDTDEELLAQLRESIAA
jgi:hypothetical protein